MIRFKWLAAWLVFCFATPAMAGEQTTIDGFGVARWGTLKQDILAAEGTPSDVDKDTGEITYNDKLIMGKKTIVRYQFETGCTDFDISQCRFSEGTYIFNDISKEFSAQLEETLTKQYGPATTTITATKAYPTLAVTGKCEVETQTSLRSRSKATTIIKSSRECSLHDFRSRITDKDVKAGACRSTVTYYGLNHQQTAGNKRNAQERGL